MAEPTYRMSMLPFGTYPNENGQGEHLGLAVPGMIQEPVNALMRLFGSGNFAQGPDYPGNADDTGQMHAALQRADLLRLAAQHRSAGRHRRARHAAAGAELSAPQPADRRVVARHAGG